VLRYYITGRKGLGGVEELIENIARQIYAGVDWIQIREKDLPVKELLTLARRVMGLAEASGGRTRVLINSRMDVALAAGAHGVHLPSDAPPPRVFRCCCRVSMMIGVSCHNQDELLRAEAEGADYALLGPVFTPLSKAGGGPALGLDKFADLKGQVTIPVIALGGITEARIAGCDRAGAAGVAGISLFQSGE
jgi:thiamine-phosphate pyrophosphorylase